MATSLHIETPTLESGTINARLGKRVFLKMECYQPVGSFKIRGIGALCQQAVEQGREHLVCPSGGNAGYAAAYAGKQLGAKVTVVVPESTSRMARQRIAAEGAEVIIHGPLWHESNILAQKLGSEGNSAYIHSYDDPVIWTGHSTLVDEAARQCPRPDVVIVAVGGGGLICGLIEGMHNNGWDDVPVMAVETEGTASAAATLKAGKLIRLDKIDSIATTLAALEVTPKLLDWSQRHSIESVIVSDADAVDACLRFANDLRVVVEPSCGAALSLIYRHSDLLAPYDSAMVVVCGGAGTTIGQILDWRATL
jgi:L-serine/L-threonine ammonia-lyase